MIFAIVVYATALKVIWTNRRHLDGFMNPLNENPFASTITTSIEITYEERFIVKDGGSQEISEASAEVEPDPYSVNVEVGRQTPAPTHTLPAALRMRTLTRDAAESETNTEAWLYARVAVLFFIALIIAWVPSSINRLYGLARPGVINFPLNYISSFVFPLQGFWNSIVYIITSQSACRRLWNQLFSRNRRRTLGRVGTNLTSASDDRYLDTTAGKQRLESVASLH